MPLNIRPAVREDAALILRFITDLAIYEKAEHEVKTDVAGIENSLFGEGSTTHGLICELDGEPIGYAVYFFNYSTWLGKHGLYLEDLYVTPEQRGVGAGKRCCATWPSWRWRAVAGVSSGRYWIGTRRPSSSTIPSAPSRRTSGSAIA